MKKKYIDEMKGNSSDISVGDPKRVHVQADQSDAGDGVENTCLRTSVDLPQGNFRAQRDDFNEGKLLRIAAESLVASAPTSSANSGFLVRDEDFWVSALPARPPIQFFVVFVVDC